MLGSWAEAGSSAAMTWACKLSGKERLAGISAIIGKDEQGAIRSANYQVMNSWAEEDPQAAAKWVNSLPDGDLRDQGVVQVAQHLRYLE